MAAFSAGCVAVLKPSELSPATADTIERLLPQYVEKDAAVVVNGGADVATVLLRHKFDFIMYTGNGVVGRIVQRAAAEHLTPVCLELGGKSPAIVDKGVDITVCAQRIAWGRWMNCGQTCIAVDYVLVHK